MRGHDHFIRTLSTVPIRVLERVSALAGFEVSCLSVPTHPCCCTLLLQSILIPNLACLVLFHFDCGGLYTLLVSAIQFRLHELSSVFKEIKEAYHCSIALTVADVVAHGLSDETANTKRLALCDLPFRHSLSPQGVSYNNTVCVGNVYALDFCPNLRWKSIEMESRRLARVVLTAELP
jgi:hypothetical protein